MNITREQQEKGTLLTLVGEMTIYHAAQTQAALFEDVEALESPVSLDLSGVSELDTAGVQLLLFARKLLSESNKTLQIVKGNEQVDNVLTMLDVASQFTVESDHDL